MFRIFAFEIELVTFFMLGFSFFIGSEWAEDIVFSSVACMDGYIEIL